MRKGQTYTYTWEVRDRSAPGPKDPSSVVWMYHSHHSEVQDTNTGLYGAMIISAKVPLPQQGPLQQDDGVAAQGQHSRATLSGHATQGLLYNCVLVQGFLGCDADAEGFMHDRAMQRRTLRLGCHG